MKYEEKTYLWNLIHLVTVCIFVDKNREIVCAFGLVKPEYV